MAPMSDRPRTASVDTARERSLSFAPPRTLPSLRPPLERAPLPVGQVDRRLADPSGSGHLSDEGSGYPIQIAEGPAPGAPRRDARATASARLAASEDPRPSRPRSGRRRLRQDHPARRLLAPDPAADAVVSTRPRTTATGSPFLHHLVAAGREHDPGFAPRTAALLAEAGAGRSRPRAVLDAFVRELPSIAVGGAVLILDDFHLVDDAADVRYIARELVARAPERLTIAFASRRAPAIPLSKLRAVGEVAELGTDDLRFDAAETARLFNETYGRRWTRTSSPIWPHGRKAGSLRCSWSRLRCAIDRPRRSAASFGPSPAPTTISTTTSPRRSSATCRKSCSAS